MPHFATRIALAALSASSLLGCELFGLTGDAIDARFVVPRVAVGPGEQITALFLNEAEGPVYRVSNMGACETGIEQLVDGEWQVVRFDFCLPVARLTYQPIERGVEVIDYFSYERLAELSGSRSGRFRFHWHLSKAENANKVQEIKSSMFSLSDR